MAGLTGHSSLKVGFPSRSSSMSRNPIEPLKNSPGKQGFRLTLLRWNIILFDVFGNGTKHLLMFPQVKILKIAEDIEELKIYN